jgi:hypothetical protein
MDRMADKNKKEKWENTLLHDIHFLKSIDNKLNITRNE